MRFSLRQLLLGTAILSVLLFLALFPTARPFHRLYNHVTHLAFSPDGKQLAVGRFRAYDAGVMGKMYVADVSRTVSLVDTATLSDQITVAHNFRPGNQGPAFILRGRSTSVAFSPNSSILFVSDRPSQSLRAWNISVGTWATHPLVAEARGGWIVHSPNNDLLAICYQKGFTIWNIVSEKRIVAPPINGWPSGFSPDSTKLATVNAKGVEIWSIPDRKLLRTFHKGKDSLDRVTCVEFSPDGDTVAVRSESGLRLFSIATGSEQTILPEHFEIRRTATGWGTTRNGHATAGVAFTPDGSLLAAWGSYGLKFFDTSSKPTLSREEPSTRIACFAFSTDGKIYATGDYKGKVAIYSTATGKELCATQLQGNAPPNLN